MWTWSCGKRWGTAWKPRNSTQKITEMLKTNMPRQPSKNYQGSVCSIHSLVQHLQSLQTWTKWMLPMHRGGCIAPQSSSPTEDLSWVEPRSQNMEPESSSKISIQHLGTFYGHPTSWDRVIKVIWVFRYPQIIHFNRVFPYKPFILGYPYFWKHPYIHRIAVTK